MSNNEFRAFLNLLMCSDPWPIAGKDGEEDRQLLEALADSKARALGYDGWYVAYHEFKPT